MLKSVFCWSGGKDSALCLYKVLQEKKYGVKYLFTTVNQTFQRVSMHGVREDLIERQAKAIGIPLVKMYVSEGTNAEYEQEMGKFLRRFISEGITHSVFGDIFLEDLRMYRIRKAFDSESTAIYKIEGRLTEDTLAEWSEEIRNLTEIDKREIILDLSQVWYVSAKAVEAFIELTHNVYLLNCPMEVRNVLYSSGLVNRMLE